jgi:hypothetical protein
MIMPHDRVDVTRANEHGDLVVLLPRGQGRPSFWEPELVDLAIERMVAAGYDQDLDCLLIAGHMAPLVRVACTLAQEFPRARGLFYDSVQGTYNALPLSISEIEDVDEPDVGGRLPQGARVPRGAGEGRRRAS